MRDSLTQIFNGYTKKKWKTEREDWTNFITCRSGNRSGQATDFLRENGYDNVHNMAGGINAWKSAGLDVE